MQRSKQNTEPAGPVVMLIGSRTGGPLIPLLGLKDDLLAWRTDLRFCIVGVRGGFEERIARAENLPLDFLAEVKSPARPSGVAGFLWPILLPFQLMVLALRLLLSTFRAYQIIRHRKPSLILSMSNFLTVPVFWAGRLYRRVNRTSLPRLALHQLDIENRTVQLVGRLSDRWTVGLPQLVRTGRAAFQPNPVRYARFDPLDRQTARLQLDKAGLVPAGEERPLLLVFGGGSGARFLNQWVDQSVPALTENFFVLHLTGFLQKVETQMAAGPNGSPTRDGITTREGLTDLMPAALVAADVVVARAGMSTISELLYLKKNAYIVPIPASHQVTNARAVAAYFQILEQQSAASWVERLRADLSAGWPQHRAVQWDYYSAGSREVTRDELLALLQN